MQIIPLDAAGKAQLLQAWRSMGTHPGQLISLQEDFDRPNMDWYEVRDNQGSSVAIFEIRHVPANYSKSMTVFFAPKFGLDMEDISFETVQSELEVVIDALVNIFQYLVTTINGNKDTIKIYNDHSMVHFIYFKFAEHLSKMAKDLYSVKFYGKWIEIASK